MNILVTGGFGFIGSHFVEQAVYQGHKVIVLDNLTYAADLKNISDSTQKKIVFKKVDISEISDLEKNIRKISPVDVVVNFAAESHVDRSIKNGDLFLKTNVSGTYNLLELTRRGLASRFIQVSTDEVYGTITEGSWDELQALNPRSPYSASKASAEHFCSAFRNTYNLDILISRCANNFGPRQSVEKLIPKTITNILSQESIPIYGNGNQRREWISVDEHAAFILAMAASSDKLDSVYNIGGIEKSNLELVHEIVAIMKADPGLIKFVEDRQGHDFRYSVIDSKIREEFHYIKRQNFEDKLERTIEWYRENDAWIRRSKSRALK